MNLWREREVAVAGKEKIFSKPHADLERPDIKNTGYATRYGENLYNYQWMRGLDSN